MENLMPESRGDASQIEPSLIDPVDAINRLQEELKHYPLLPELPTIHHFVDGMYARTCEIQAGGVVVSRRHRKECVFIVLAGVLHVKADNGLAVVLWPGSVLKAPAGKRAVFADPRHGAALITTVHRLDPYTEDLAEIEKQLTIPEDGIDYYDFSNKLKNKLLALVAPAGLLENKE